LSIQIAIRISTQIPVGARLTGSRNSAVVRSTFVAVRKSHAADRLKRSEENRAYLRRGRARLVASDVGWGVTALKAQAVTDWLKSLARYTASTEMISSPAETAVESTVSNSVEWLRLFVEVTGAAIIAIGVIASLWLFVSKRAGGFNSVRLRLATYLALALEFQLGADILSTAIAPTWDKIGKLGAIAVIRTALNFFLMQEMSQERETSDNLK
jgi:uncharacterized membrane protein